MQKNQNNTLTRPEIHRLPLLGLSKAHPAPKMILPNALFPPLAVRMVSRFFRTRLVESSTRAALPISRKRRQSPFILAAPPREHATAIVELEPFPCCVCGRYISPSDLRPEVVVWGEAVQKPYSVCFAGDGWLTQETGWEVDCGRLR